MATISAHNLGKSYGDAIILQGINLNANPGESIAFMSPSGSGKSTLLSMLGLLLTPTEGSVYINDIDTATLDDKTLSKMRLENIGFLFQHTQLIGSLRAIENVCVPTNFSTSDTSAARDFAQDLLVRLGLQERMLHFPYQLSIGQKRRVALARALIMNPSILIADEPTNDLDSACSKTVANTLFEHCDQGGILLFATHDEELASRASRIMRLRDNAFVEER